jgi:hypothetical protein
MDVPTRQAYVMAIVDPSGRTAAAAYMNTARYPHPADRPVAGAASLRAVPDRRRAQERRPR